MTIGEALQRGSTRGYSATREEKQEVIVSLGPIRLCSIDVLSAHFIESTVKPARITEISVRRLSALIGLLLSV